MTSNSIIGRTIMNRSRCFLTPAWSVLLLLSFTGMAQAQTTVPGLIHLWSGEGNANDSVGTANGTLGMTTAFGTGLNGQAFSFDGQQSSIVNPLGVDINPSVLPQMTMGMWVKMRSAPNTQGWVIGNKKPPSCGVFGTIESSIDKEVAHGPNWILSPAARTKERRRD